MPNNDSLFQLSISIDNTVFKTVDILLKLFQSAGEDDVQGQVVMALEALGSALLVSPVRISEGVEALSQLGVGKGINCSTKDYEGGIGPGTRYYSRCAASRASVKERLDVQVTIVTTPHPLNYKKSTTRPEINYNYSECSSSDISITS